VLRIGSTGIRSGSGQITDWVEEEYAISMQSVC
jgi:hypothetical protein